MPTTPSHVELLTSARALRAAALEDDVERVHAELTRLRTALLEHARGEAGDLDGLDGPVGSVVRDGQRRILTLVNDLLFGVQDGEEDECCCLVRSTEVEVALRRQARLEDILLGQR